MPQKKTIIIGLGILLIGGAALWFYLSISSQYVYIDQSVVDAPIINLSPVTSGVLQQVFVTAGQTVTANTPIARVGDEIVESQTGGVIATVNQDIGEYENALTGQGVVATMVDPAQLRVVGKLDEDKGLEYVHVGDVVRFTVDAFGSKQYDGVVDEVSQVSLVSVTSNIFNQRPTDEFDVKVRFDPAKYPELKSGMSARIWVYKN